MPRVPKVGQKIYIPDHEGSEGGVTEVTRVQKMVHPDGWSPLHFVDTGDGDVWNWEEDLALVQAKLRKKFGKRPARIVYIAANTMLSSEFKTKLGIF